MLIFVDFIVRNMRFGFVYPGVLAFLCWILVSCQQKQATLPTVPVPTATANLQPPFAFDASKMVALPSGVKYFIVQQGVGQPPRKGQKVVAKYHGMLADSSSTVFDSSYEREKQGQSGTFDFAIGEGQVIPCWDEVFGQLTIGTKAVVFCPSDKAYGTQGSGKIPPNANLYFHVELVSIQ
jgi:FKBP-type peptidyl-prolyl cis-trans isomerase